MRTDPERIKLLNSHGWPRVIGAIDKMKQTIPNDPEVPARRGGVSNFRIFYLGL